MASSYSTSLGIEKMATGDQSGAWGTTSNHNWDILDRISAYTAIALSDASTATLTVREASPDAGTENLQNGMYRVIKFTGSLSQACTITIAPNTTKMFFIVANATTDAGSSGPYSLAFSQGSGANVTVQNGNNAVIYCDGAGSGAVVTDALSDLQIGNDLSLVSDSAVVNMGADNDITITHVADVGLKLKQAGATGDGSPFVLTLQTGELDIAADDVLGQIDFQAPDEAAGTDAILVAAGIAAVSEGDFSSSNNATKLSFKTAASGAAAETASLSSTGVFAATSFTGSGAGLTTGTTPLTTLDIDGGTDIGEALTTSDLIIVDNGAGGTNRKSALSRVNTLVQADGGFPLTALDIDGGTDIGEAIVDADLFIIDNGAGGTNRKVAASRILTYVGGVPRSYLAGLTLSNDSGDTDHDINVTAGIARSADNLSTLELTSEQTKKIDASWATGNDAGGLASNLTLSNSTWYHVHLFSVGSTVEIGFDTSVTAANLISNDGGASGKYRRIGAVLTDGSANILQFSQIGDRFIWTTPTLDINTSVQGTTAISYTLATPLGIKMVAILEANVIEVGAWALYLSSLSQTDEAAEIAGSSAGRNQLSALNTEPSSTGSYAGEQLEIETNTSSQIRARADVTLEFFSARTSGYIDSRGRDV